MAIGYRLYGRLTIHDEKSSSVLMDEIKIGDQKQSVDDRTSEFLLQEIKEKLQSLDEILRPKETFCQIVNCRTIATFPEWNRKLMYIRSFAFVIWFWVNKSVSFRKKKKA